VVCSTLAPPLTSREVHVWRAHLDQRADSLAQLARTLSLAERERAAQFHHPRDRDRFVLRRGVLRTILGRYLAVGPGDVRFSCGRYDKPFLDRYYHDRPLNFNVAHRRGFALYAVTSRSAVGVDIEYVEPVSDLEDVAAQFFSERELQVLHLVPESARLLAFLRLWTMKEAYLKALGEGLMRPPNQVDVYLDSSRTTALQEIEGHTVESGLWRIETVVPAPGYIGAVVAEAGDWRIRWLDW
jgi:4'-phosphopantetheinyl transferase